MTTTNSDSPLLAALLADARVGTFTGTLTLKDLGLDSPRSFGAVELKDGAHKTLWGYVGTVRFQVVHHSKQDMQIVCYDGPAVDEALRIFNELR